MNAFFGTLGVIVGSIIVIAVVVAVSVATMSAMVFAFELVETHFAAKRVVSVMKELNLQSDTSDPKEAIVIIRESLAVMEERLEPTKFSRFVK